MFITLEVEVGAKLEPCGIPQIISFLLVFEEGRCWHARGGYPVVK